MTHPGLGYKIDQLDITDHNVYSEVMKSFGKATKLPALAYQSKIFSDLEDESIWSRSWVAIGSSHEIPEIGDMLPYTIGHHGIHVQRIDSKTIIGRFNKAQHGGCRAVPAQCQTGNKTKCSFTSCGYSLDRKSINNIEIEDSNTLSHQYLGVMPERLIMARTYELGPFIFVNIDPDSNKNEIPDIALSEKYLSNIYERNNLIFSEWMECQANWKLLCNSILSNFEPNPDHMHTNNYYSINNKDHCQLQFKSNYIFKDYESKDIQVYWLSPNFFLMSLENYIVCLIIQPVGLQKSVLRVQICSYPANSMDNSNFIPSFNETGKKILEYAESLQKVFTSLAENNNSADKKYYQESVLEESFFSDYFNKSIAQKVVKKNEYYWNAPLYKNVF